MPDVDPNRTVQCIKLDQELPGLAKPPFPTEFGQHIYENVSKQAWDQWIAESVRLINTYCRPGSGLELGTPEGTHFMLDQLRVWLGMQEGDLAETAWSAPSASDPKTSPAEGE